jgi:hypothetical protein
MIDIIRYYPLLSVIIRYYPLLSVIIRYYPLLSVIIRYYPLLSVIIRYYPLLSVIYLPYVRDYYPLLSPVGTGFLPPDELRCHDFALLSVTNFNFSTLLNNRDKCSVTVVSFSALILRTDPPRPGVDGNETNKKD